MKICVPVNSGGHLTQSLILAESLKNHDIKCDIPKLINNFIG